MRDLDKIEHKIVIELDNRQVAAAILGFILVSVGTFAAGVLVGQGADDHLLAAVVGADGEASEARGDEPAPGRIARLARIRPGTRAVHSELEQASARPTPSDPTEAARIEAHRQLQAANAAGTAHSLGPIPVAAAGEPAPEQEPLTIVNRSPAEEQKALDDQPEDATSYALEFDSFASPDLARAVAEQLDTSDQGVRVRELAGDDGEARWRVEIGRFDSTRTASAFQRRFERSQGYATVMVPLR